MKPSKTLIVGLTGGIACGKSALSDALRAVGADVIDADAISRALTRDGGEALPAIRARFGDVVFDGDSLNRRTLGALAFADEQNRRALEDILHPMILSRMREQIDACKARGARAVVLDVPLLYECGLDAWCDVVWCASVPADIQRARLRRRDGLTARQANERIRAQMPLSQKRKRAGAVIDTSGSMKDSAEHVLSLWQALLEGENH